MQIEENKPLAPFTTLGVGGPARYFAEVRSDAEIAAACKWAEKQRVPLFVLGGGSNLVVADSGFPGLILRVVPRRTAIRQQDGSNEVLFCVEAGVSWDSLVQRAVDFQCAGIECLAGIPGSVGGTPVQNVGAYGQEVANVIDRVRAFDLREKIFVELPASECGFAYRRSRFNSTDKGRFLVTRVDFRLQRGGKPTLSYADLERAFHGKSAPSLAEVAAEVRRIRQSKGMLLVEGDADSRSAGSFFKNPIMPAEAVAAIAAAAGNEPPKYHAEEAGKVKLSAAWLIEQAGFAKGFTRGAAGISSKHTLALVNRGGATAAEILALADEIRSGVEEKFGVQLEMEPVLVGF